MEFERRSQNKSMNRMSSSQNMNDSRKLQKVEQIFLDEPEKVQSEKIQPKVLDDDELDALLIGYFLDKKLVSDVQLHREAIVPLFKGQVDLSQRLDRVNQKLRQVHLQIGSMVDEIEGSSNWGIVSTKFDIVGQNASPYTDLEISYFKLLISSMLVLKSGSTRKNGKINKISALNMVSQLDTLQGSSLLTKQRAQELISQFCSEFWLRGHPDFLTLGNRAILELTPWLLEHYKPYILECFLCKEPIFYGSPCPNLECSQKLHFYCHLKWAELVSIPRCPKCNCIWKEVSNENEEEEEMIENVEEEEMIENVEEEENEEEKTQTETETEKEKESESEKEKKSKRKKKN